MIRFALVSLFVAGSALAQQNVTAFAGGQSVNLVVRPLGTVAVTMDKAGSTQEFLKGEVKGEIENQATGAVISGIVATGLTRVPFAGTAAVAGLGKAKMLFRKKQAPRTESYNLSFVQGLSASTTVSASDLTLVVPAGIIGANSSPVLLRANPSAKDQARIVRATHVKMAQTKSAINPFQVEVLGIEQMEVPVRLETRSNGDTAIMPSVPLAAGEYVLALVDSSTKELPASAWEFRVQ